MPKKRSSTPAKKATKATAKPDPTPPRKRGWGDRDDDGRGPADAVTLSTTFAAPEEA